MGQLGLGPDVMEKTRPALVDSLKDVVQISAGGMHNLCLNRKGEVYSFGCNDEGALGRATADEEGSEAEPRKIQLPAPCLKISAGDSHSACLLNGGRVYAWGSFRVRHSFLRIGRHPTAVRLFSLQIIALGQCFSKYECQKKKAREASIIRRAV